MIEKMGKREQQKLDRHQLIISEAKTLIAKHGFRQLKLATLAKRCNLAVGTLYNYFQCRQQLLLSMLVEQTTEANQQLDELHKDPPEAPYDGLSRFIEICCSHIQDKDRLLWREVIAAVLTEPEKFQLETDAMDSTLSQHNINLICHYQEQGELDQHTDPQSLARIMRAIALNAVINFLHDSQLSREDMLNEIHQSIATLLHGITHQPLSATRP